MKLNKLLYFLLENRQFSSAVMRAFKSYPDIEWAWYETDLSSDDRVTIVNGAIDISRTYSQPSRNPNKPNGIWYGFGIEWFEHVIDAGMDRNTFLRNPYVYKITSIRAANVKYLNEENIKEFHNEYRTTTGPESIDWEHVANNFDGVELEFEPDTLKDRYRWLSGWDIKSGCIWSNISSVGLERIISPRREKQEKEEEERNIQLQTMNNELDRWWQHVLRRNYTEAVTNINDIYSKYHTNTRAIANPFHEEFIQKIYSFLAAAHLTDDPNDPRLSPEQRQFRNEVALQVIRPSVLYRIPDRNDSYSREFGSFVDRITRTGAYAPDNQDYFYNRIAHGGYLYNN